MFDLRLGGGSIGKSNNLEGTANVKFFWSPEVTSEVTCRMEKIDLHITAIYKYTGKTKNIWVQDGKLVESKMGEYQNLDLTILKTFMQKRLSVNMGIRNLFDVTNITSVGGSEAHSEESGSSPVAWGRTYFVKLSFSIFQNESDKKIN
jgi:outer membrane receptor for ferrienterochelin and colicins